MILVEFGGFFCFCFFGQPPPQRLEEIMKRTRKTDTPEKVDFWFKSITLYDVAIESKIHNLIKLSTSFSLFAQKDVKSSAPPQVNGGSSKPESESNKGKRVKCLLNNNAIIAYWKKEVGRLFLQYNWKVPLFHCLMYFFFPLSAQFSVLWQAGLWEQLFIYLFVTQHEITENKSCYCEGTDHMVCVLWKAKPPLYTSSMATEAV